MNEFEALTMTVDRFRAYVSGRTFVECSADREVDVQRMLDDAGLPRDGYTVEVVVAKPRDEVTVVPPAALDLTP